MKKYLFIFIILLPVSYFAFNKLYSSLELLKEKKTVEEKHEESTKIENDVMLYNKLLTECWEKHQYNLDIDCEEEIKPKPKKEANTKQEEKTTNGLIQAIYIFMILALNFQLATFVYAYWEKEKIDEVFFHLSDWAINSPPMLGVLGTIISFALLVGQMENGDILAIFSERFFDAAITTIIGGLIYIFNLLLKVKIYTRIK